MTQGATPPSGPERSGEPRAEALLRKRIATLETEIAQQRTALGDRQSRFMRLQRRLSRTERLSALAALLARLAHELGTPLHSIAGHLDLLTREPGLPDHARQRVEVVAGEVDRLAGLLRSHLETLRVPAARPAPTDINECIARAAALVEPVLVQRGIALTLDLDADAGEPFLCDPAQIEQAAMNLVQNAMDAMTGGGVLVVHTAVTGQGRSLSVADSGEGMDADVLAHASEPFFTTKEPGRGTGLGLMICDEIARAHGGELWIDSKPGLGTVVTLSLAQPARPAGDPDEQGTEGGAAHG